MEFNHLNFCQYATFGTFLYPVLVAPWTHAYLFPLWVHYFKQIVHNIIQQYCALIFPNMCLPQDPSLYSTSLTFSGTISPLAILSITFYYLLFTAWQAANKALSGIQLP